MTISGRGSPAFAAFLLVAGVAEAATIQEPYTLSSSNGVLDLLMVAEAQTVPTLSPLNPTGLVYSVCIRPSNGSETCPPPPATVIPYAGPLLKLQQGDVVKVHLVNKLPPLTDSFHASNPNEPNETFLSMNPTNIHFHGMLVSAHYPTAAVPNYGDNINVYTFNGKNGAPPALAAAHADVRIHSTDYSITIPKNHPSGLYWIHSHIHGISLNQITSGLSGTISVGNVGDYVCKNDSCSSFFASLPIRDLVIKDLQVLANGTRMDEQDSAMCLSPSTGGLVLPPLNGYCAGQNFSAANPPGPDYTGGRWFVTINGQQFPTVPMTSPGGEIWRFANESGSASHNLSVYDPATKQNMIFQVLSVDGVTLASNVSGDNSGRFHVVRCPGAPTYSAAGSAPLCADQILMMPSSRAEIWVAYRNGFNRPTTPPSGTSAILLDSGYNTGPDGDTWPAVNLAQINFTPVGTANPPPYLMTSGVPPLTVSNPLQISQDVNQDETTARVGPDQGVAAASCVPLPKGHRRRIFFSVTAEDPDLFGLGYEEVDTNKYPNKFGIYPAVPNSFKPITAFNGAMPTICLTLGYNNVPVPETWELVNLSGENHNFHMHQTKFQVLAAPPESGTSAPSNGPFAYVDNVPVIHANGTVDENSPKFNPNSPGGCLSADAWRSGACPSTPTVVSIPFFVAGDYVFHCHILEHEDGGMMARIRVRILGQN